jgi:hypothetical protein
MSENTSDHVLDSGDLRNLRGSRRYKRTHLPSSTDECRCEHSNIRQIDSTLVAFSTVG